MPSCRNNFIDLDTLKRRALLIQPVLTNVIQLTEPMTISPTETIITSSPPPTEPTTNRGQRQAQASGPGYQYFFPYLSFQLSGLLTSWVFAASNVTSPNGMYSQFQIWRPTGERAYVRINTTESNVAPHAVPGELNVYEYNFDSQPLQYSQGDIVGIYQPPVELSHLKVAFVNDELVELPGAIRIPINTEPAKEYDLSITISELIGMVSPVLTVKAMPLPASTATPNPTSTLTESASTTLLEINTFIAPTNRVTGILYTTTTTTKATSASIKLSEISTSVALTRKGTMTTALGITPEQTPMLTTKATSASIKLSEISTSVALTRKGTMTTALGITPEQTPMLTTGDPGVTTPQGGLSDVAIAGVAVGGVLALLLLLVILLLVCMCVMNSRRKARKTNVTMLDVVENPEYSHGNVMILLIYIVNAVCFVIN